MFWHSIWSNINVCKFWLKNCKKFVSLPVEVLYGFFFAQN